MYIRRLSSCLKSDLFITANFNQYLFEPSGLALCGNIDAELCFTNRACSANNNVLLIGRLGHVKLEHGRRLVTKRSCLYSKIEKFTVRIVFIGY